MRWTKASLMLISFIALFSGSGYANEEITVDLPGGVQMEFVGIEPGTFMMGSPDSDSLAKNIEKPQRQVTISKGFYLGKFEITQGQWNAVMGNQPWSGKDKGYVQEDPNNPAVYISWYDVHAFIHTLNQAAGDSLYRLPTEAEWEYVCRAGTTTGWSFGNDESQLRDYAWNEQNAWKVGEQYAHAVGTKLPNPWGLFDMHGNVYEWVQDWYGLYSDSSQTDPTGPASGATRIHRGGSDYHNARYARSAYRYNSAPGDRWDNLGARLLRMGPKIGTAVTPQSWGQVKKDAR